MYIWILKRFDNGMERFDIWKFLIMLTSSYIKKCMEDCDFEHYQKFPLKLEKHYQKLSLNDYQTLPFLYS